MNREGRDGRPRARPDQLRARFLHFSAWIGDYLRLLAYTRRLVALVSAAVRWKDLGCREMTGGSTDLDGGRMPWGSGGPTTGAAGRVSFALGSITRHLFRNSMGIWRAVLRSSGIDLRLVGLRVHFLVPRRPPRRFVFDDGKLTALMPPGNSRHTKSHRLRVGSASRSGTRVHSHASLHRVTRPP